MSENAAVSAPEQKVQKPQRNKYGSDKKKRRMPKWLRIMIPIVLVAGIVYGAWAIVQKITAKNDPGVIEGTVMTNTLADQITGWATISAKQTAEYGVGLTGTVTEVAVNAGDVVKAGDLLFVIDPVQLQDELDTAEKNLSTAEKALKEISAKLAYTDVTAPFSGKLIKAGDLKTGDQGAEGASVGTLVDDSTMRLELYFVRGLFGQIQKGQIATVSLPDQMQQVTGTVSQIDDIEKPVDGSVCFRVYIDFKNPGVLVAGDTATASVTTAKGDVTPIGSGTMDYCRSVDLVLKAGGEVSYANLVEYGNYTAGQKMVSIDTAQLRDQIDGAQKTYDEALAAAQKIRDKMQNTEVRSEIDGMVSGVVIEPGSKLENSTTPVITVSNTSSLIVNINIDELDISKVSLGMQVSMTNDSGVSAMGTITYISYTATTSQDSWSGMSSTFPATVSLANDGTLLPGMSVNYTITATVKENCLVVPSTAITYTEDGSTVVFVKDGQDFTYDKVEGLPEDQVPEGYYPVAVAVGLSDASNTEVEGLQEGTVVYAGKATNEGQWG
ncbi:MAG: HlyD family efflux transporter periplasmic adaptor subunit [Clostridiaceae bacterium]|nr:HlyD family efflux transporter periplasmic adaptor subunit [Clostridiaceae bacterium]